MRRSSICVFAALALILGSAEAGLSADLDEFKVKRQEVFEFTEKPMVTRDTTSQPERFVITFTSKAYCDATVALEDANGRIVRHLACGVLGDNAPEPFAKKSLAQQIVWDGKDDQGKYVDDKNTITVRVSLGLKPRFERALFWSPQKRVGYNLALPCATPEGVYVYEGNGLDSVRLYDHDGGYLRTVYPFPTGTIEQAQGLDWREYPQDGGKHPVMHGLWQKTMLNSGTSCDGDKISRGGRAGTAMAVFGDRIALPMLYLGRLGTKTGTPPGLSMKGPRTTLTGVMGNYYNNTGLKDWETPPTSAAFSPDGKTLYLTGYYWSSASYLGPSNIRWHHVVMKVDYAADKPPEVFVGERKNDGFGDGEDDRHFRCPVSVATDSQGRVYVADHFNDRIQIFDADGKFLKSIKSKRPCKVHVHPKTGEIYVFSWPVQSRWVLDQYKEHTNLPMYRRYGGFDKPDLIAECRLPTKDGASTFFKGGAIPFDTAVDWWADRPVIWLVPHIAEPLRLCVEVDGKLEVKRDFAKDAADAVTRVHLPDAGTCHRQRLYVHPRTGMVYVGEADSGVGKSFKQLVEIDPKTGKARLMDLPLTVEDMCIDQDGLFYLRTDIMVGRYDPATWREVPFDYGEERTKVGFDASIKTVDMVSGLVLPSTGRPCWWHLGGIAISAQGHLAVTCYNDAKPESRQSEEKKNFKNAPGVKYSPKLYPGRVTGWEIHVFDKHGKIVHQDAVGGLPMMDGIGIDRDDNIYTLSAANRILDGKPYLNARGETLMKFKPSDAKWLASAQPPDVMVPLSPQARPKRQADVNPIGHAGATWVEGADWMYGAVGMTVNGDCICENARFALDCFGRSFAPELDIYSVAVLDSSGNLILRIGKYGNVDEGQPLVAAGSPAKPRPIGGDEVALSYAAYVGTHTDRRLFITDAGNARIVSVKLDYHRTETVPLGDRAPKLPAP